MRAPAEIDNNAPSNDGSMRLIIGYDNRVPRSVLAAAAKKASHNDDFGLPPPRMSRM
jgi:hypothetical protein